MRFLIGLFIFSFTCLFGSEGAILVEELLFSSSLFGTCHASTITETKEGLIVAYYAGSEEGAHDVSIYLSKQENAGRQWQSPEKVYQDLGAPAWNPVLFNMPSGEVFLFYKAGYDPTRWSGFLMRSHDCGHTWSEPAILPAGILGPIKNKPILLSNGTLLCGSAVQSYLIWGCQVERTQDKGYTWERSNPIPYRELPQEPFFRGADNLWLPASTDNPLGIIQPTLWTEDGKNITLLCRSRRVGYICKATSDDGGKTWSKAYPTKLPNPNSGIDAVLLQDGRVLLIYNDSKTQRTPLNLAVSADGGESWDKVLVLEDKEGSFSYPAVIQTEDGLIHITYSWNRERIKHVVVDPARL